MESLRKAFRAIVQTISEGFHGVFRLKVLAAFYLLALATIFVLENAKHIAGMIWGEGIQELNYSQPGFLYQELTKAGYLLLRPHSVRPVMFDPLKEPAWLQGGYTCDISVS